MKILLATGSPEFDAAIKNEIKHVDYVGSVMFREGLLDGIARKKPDVVILFEKIEGLNSFREMIEEIRFTFPDVRIIYIFKEENIQEKHFLYHFMIFDVISGDFHIKELENLIERPRQFRDVVKEEGYRQNRKQMRYETDTNETYTMGQFPYQPLPNAELGTNELYQEIVSFWSVSDQSGKTTNASNTAIRMVTNRALKVLLIDFSVKNPTVHFHFGLNNPHKNLGAMLEDYENEKLSPNIGDYFETHAHYRNLSILPGDFLKATEGSSDARKEVIEKVILYAQQNNYSSVLIDCDSGLEKEETVAVLKRSTKILLHINESASSLYAATKCFDTEFGPFVEKLLDKKKVTAVINRSNEHHVLEIAKEIEYCLSVRVGAAIPELPEFNEFLYSGRPILSGEVQPVISELYLQMCNLIHEKLFISSVDKKVRDKKTKKTSFFFKK